MALYKKSFIDARRQELMDYTVKIEYEVAEAEQWFEATENERKIEGNLIIYTLLFPNYLHTAHKITAIRFLDASDNVIAQRSMSIEVNSTQTVLCEISIDYEEV